MHYIRQDLELDLKDDRMKGKQEFSKNQQLNPPNK
jgi:hypothetical protein